MPTIRNRFYPLRDVSEHDIIPFYSHMTTGQAGQLVKIVTGAANPQNLDGWSSSNVGASVAGTVSYRYEGKAKITPSASGDTRFNSLGLTLYGTAETDENLLPLKYFPHRAKEIGVVISGENVPVVCRGLFGLWGKDIDQSRGNVQPGNLVVVSYSGDGRLAAVDPSALVATATAVAYSRDQVVGKWLTALPTATNTGLQNEFSAQGGYALFQLDCHA